jgi:hypothetical protein
MYHCRTFGCCSRSLVPSFQRGKFDRVNEEGFRGKCVIQQGISSSFHTESGLVIREFQNVKLDESRTYTMICNILNSIWVFLIRNIQIVM